MNAVELWNCSICGPMDVIEMIIVEGFLWVVLANIKRKVLSTVTASFSYFSYLLFDINFFIGNSQNENKKLTIKRNSINV